MSSLLFHMRCKPLSHTRAFGLIELLVSVGIMVMVTSVVLTKQSSFNSAVVLRNQAYEVAFALRQAQLLAVSGGDRAIRRYGVHFDTARPNAYILFGENESRSPNHWYDESNNELIPPFGRFDDRFIVRGLFTGPAADDDVDALSVVFVRPNFDAVICADSSGCTSSEAAVAYIDIARRGTTGTTVGEVRRVEVNESGQISVVTY